MGLHRLGNSQVGGPLYFMSSGSAASEVQEGHSAATGQKLSHPPCDSDFHRPILGWHRRARTGLTRICPRVPPFFALGSSASRTNQCPSPVRRTGVLGRPSDARARRQNLSKLYNGFSYPSEGTGHSSQMVPDSGDGLSR